MADTALNPRQRIGDIIGRPLTFYQNISGTERRQKVQDILRLVELPPEFANRYPASYPAARNSASTLHAVSPQTPRFCSVTR